MLNTKQQEFVDYAVKKFGTKRINVVPKRRQQTFCQKYVYNVDLKIVHY